MSSTITVSAPKVERTADFDISAKIATDLDGYEELYGADALTNLITRMIITDLRNGSRAKMEVEGDGLQDDEMIAAWIADWKPGNRRTGKSKKEKATEALERLSPEEQMELLQQYNAG